MSTNKQPGRVSGRGPRIAIIGAGLGGLTAAIALKRKYGYDNFHIFDKASEIGGTWRDNIYPGAASDVPIHLYTLSTDLDPSFKYSHGTSPEIKSYWDRLCTKYSLWPHFVFNSKIVSATWSKETNSYTLVTIDPRTNPHVSRDLLNEESEGERKAYHADFIICAFGLLEIPHWPEIEGLENFKGQMFHSARWDWDVDLKDKNVCVIGNGSTTSQFVPVISQEPSTEVTQFVRTPSWYRVDSWGVYTQRWRLIFSWFPIFMKLKRWTTWSFGEIFWFFLRVKVLNRLFTRAKLTHSIKTIAPPEYRDKMIPDYPPGCKRIIFDRDGSYLKCLSRPNMQLNFDGIEKIVEGGLVTKKGEYKPFDVIISATGYATNSFPIPLRGLTDRTVEEYYEMHGGAQAYHGTTLPGYPNLCMVSGPNTVTGHNSVVFSTEVQVEYIMKLIRPIMEGKISQLDVKDEATEAYNQTMARWLKDSIYNECVSWYRVKPHAQRNQTPNNTSSPQAAGSDSKEEAGKPNLFPGPLAVMWWWMRRPQWHDYDVYGDGAEEWKRGEVRKQRLGDMALWFTLACGTTAGLMELLK